MTIAKLSPTTPNASTANTAVTVNGETLVIHDLSIAHPEAAAFVRGQLAEHGHDAATEMVRRAIPVGLVALSLGTAGIDSGSFTRSLDSFAAKVDAKSQAAIIGLDEAIARLQAGEQAVAQTATSVLEKLPAQVEAALAGQAGNVRASVAEATRAVQAAGLQELTTTLDRFSGTITGSLSLDREGPVRMLRQDLLEVLNGFRNEFGDKLVNLTSIIETAHSAQDAAQRAGAKSTRQVGAANEDAALAMLEQIATAAGHMVERTGGQSGVDGTTRRTGDGVVTLSQAITGHGPSVRLVIEAKHRTRPLTVKQYREEIAAGCRVRDAAGGLVLVPTRAEVPGEGAFARVDSYAYVVAYDDPETVSLILQILVEQVAILKIRQGDGTDVDLVQVEARVEQALADLSQLDEVGRLAVQAHKALEKLIALGRDTQSKIRVNLGDAVARMHP